MSQSAFCIGLCAHSSKLLYSCHKHGNANHRNNSPGTDGCNAFRTKNRSNSEDLIEHQKSKVFTSMKQLPFRPYDRDYISVHNNNVSVGTRCGINKICAIVHSTKLDY